jgi:hypothetical protein
MKKVIKITISILLIPPIFCVSLFFIQNRQIKHSLEEYNEAKINDVHALVRCNYNILKPEFAYIFFAMNQGHISFDQVNKIFWKVSDWKNSYTGGTTVKNTTFEKLVKMVKGDCSQFQKGGRRGEMEWIHSPAPTENEIEKEKMDFLDKVFHGLDTKANGKFIEVYGDIGGMTDGERAELGDRIRKDGLDPSVEAIRKAEEARRGLSDLTESQQRAIRQRYGNWEGLGDDELMEWMRAIDADHEEGKFSLDDY